jgi:phosphatidylinositol alpha 1,6-mannosyltransferase
MRVLVTVGFLGHFGETDGVVTTYRNLIPHFARWGEDVDIVAYGPEDRVEREGRVRLIAHRPRLPLRVDPVRWVDPAFAFSALARELAGHRYDVVQSSTPDPMGLWARHVARRHRCPFVALYHTALGQYATIRATAAAGAAVGGAAGRLMDTLLHGYFDSADLVLCPSESVRADLRERLRVPVEVLSRGVDSIAFRPDPGRRVPARARALYVGRVVPEKNLDLLARTFTRPCPADLTVVGDGPSLEGLQRALPHALFTGRLTGDSLARAYADADFFVFPSRTDTLGNVVLEAMASGLPAVVTSSMGPKELIEDGVTGFVAATDADFAAAVRTLAADPARRNAMARAARAFAETRSWAAIFERLLGVYDGVGRSRVFQGVLHAARA